MSEYIISQNCNEVHYAYSRGRFWRWDESAHVWKESHLLAQKFGKAKTVEKRLTPEAFLTSDEFIPMDDYELPDRMLTALRDAKPCKNAPIEPVEEESECATAQNVAAAVTTAENAVPTATVATPTTSENVADASSSTPVTSLQSCESAPAASAGGSSVSTIGVPPDKPLTFIPENKTPEFDYSGLDNQTVADLHFAEDEYRHGKKLAERGLVHMGNAIAAAHDALCGVVQQLDNSKHGNRGDDSFRAWCCSIGITKSSAYNLLQVSALMEGSSPRQRAILEALPPTLLYAVAKPSAPPELVEKVKSGDITTHKEYQELLAQIKAEKDRADAAETREEEAWSMVSKAQGEAQTAKSNLEVALVDLNGLTEQNAKLQQSYHDVYESRIAANLQRQKAETERDRAKERVKDAENQLASSRQMAEAAKLRGDKLKAENDALKKQPITAVVDKEEVERQAREMAAEMTADLRERLEQTASGSEQDARNAYDSILRTGRSIENIWQTVKPLFRKMPAEQREDAANHLVHTLATIQGEVSKCL